MLADTDGLSDSKLTLPRRGFTSAMRGGKRSNEVLHHSPECTENESQVPQEVLPSSGRERGVSGLYRAAFPYYSSALFFSSYFCCG